MASGIGYRPSVIEVPCETCVFVCETYDITDTPFKPSEK